MSMTETDHREPPLLKRHGLFRCTYCGVAIPWTIPHEELGIGPADQPEQGELYPYHKCYCGYGKFVRYEIDLGSPSPGAVDGHEQNQTALKVAAARYERIPLDKVVPNPAQPRRFFDAEALRGLAASIKKVGLLEDILVRPHGDVFQIVMGERRWRASQLAGVAAISAKVVELDDDEMRMLAITENVHRENLSAVEEAFSFKSYVDNGALITDLGSEFGGLGDRIAERLKVLNSHHYIEFQQERISELTQLVDQLRQHAAVGLVSYDAKVASPDEMVALVEDGYDVVTPLADGQFVMRRPRTS